MNYCDICPRQCNIDRTIKSGFCGENKLKVARAGLHYLEEPIISGNNGSGTVFFSGCNLKCIFCQNYDIAHGKGKVIDHKKLAQIFKELEKCNAHNINLVTPSHFIDDIIKAFEIYKPSIPVVYNCGGYESIKSLEKLKDYVDIFLPDFKYADNSLAKKYSNCNDYFEVCTKALAKMRALCPDDIIDDNGIMQKGMIIRHLVLPQALDNTKKVLDYIANNFGKSTYLSLMGQYTPCGQAKHTPPLDKKLKPIEYKIAISYAQKLELDNTFIQDLSSATEDFIPDFDNSPIDL